MTDFDDQLRSELDRRTESVDLPRDWARHELLPAVMSGIETRPQRVATSRAPAFAGFAAAAAIVLILVVAMPRLSVGPAATGSDARSTTAPEATPNPVGALTAHQFATQLAAGELSGKTVVVESTVVHDEAGRPTFGRTCQQSPETDAGIGLAPNGTCLLGRLDGIEPAVWVQAPYVPTYDSSLNGFPPLTWRAPSPPLEGRLVLSVAEDGLIRLVGRLRQSEPRPLMVSGAQLIDVASLDLHDVILVDAWLMGENIKECPPSPKFGGVLRGRACDPSWLTDSQLGVRGGSLLVQDEAFFQYAVDENGEPIGGPNASTPRRGVYAIAKRQEVGGCATDTPCWQWEVVGRVAPGFEPSGFLREISCAENASLAYGAPTVVDEAGLVLSCLSFRASSDSGDGVRVTNPDGNLRQLRLEWAGTPCDIASTFTVFEGPNGYVINGERPDHACDTSLAFHSMTLDVNREVDAEMVSASLSNSGPGPSLTPTPPSLLGCWSGPPGSDADELRALVKITDETGLIALCEATTSAASGVANKPLVIENPDGDEYVLRLTWEGVCNLSGRFRLRPSESGFELVVSVPSHEIICDGYPVAHEVFVYLDEPIPVASLQTTFVEERASLAESTAPGTPVASPPVSMVCGGARISISLTDRAGLVSDCSPWEWDGDSDPFPEIGVQNPGGNANRLLVVWNPYSGCIDRATVELTNDEDGVAIQIVQGPNIQACLGPMWFAGLELELTEPIRADSVELNQDLEPAE